MTTSSGGLQRHENADIFVSNQKEHFMGTIITKSDKEVLHFFDEMKRISDLIDHLQADNRHLLDGENYLTDTELAGKLKLSKTGRKTQAEQAYAAGLQTLRHIALLPDRRKNPIPGKRYRTTAGKEPERSVLILPYYQIGGKILYRESDIVRLLEKNRKEAF